MAFNNHSQYEHILWCNTIINELKTIYYASQTLIFKISSSAYILEG